MAIHRGLVAQEATGYATGAALVGGGAYATYETFATQAVLSHRIAETTQAACVNDPTVHTAVAEALARQVGGGPIGGDVCAAMDFSGSPMANLAQNTAEQAARAGGGHYADLLNALHDRFAESTGTGIVSLGTIALGVVAFGVAGHLRRRRQAAR